TACGCAASAEAGALAAGDASGEPGRRLSDTAGSALARRDCGVRLLIGTARAAPAQTARPALVGTARPAPAPPREPVPLIRPSPLGRSTDGGARPTLSSVNTPCAGYPGPRGHELVPHVPADRCPAGGDRRPGHLPQRPQDAASVRLRRGLGRIPDEPGRGAVPPGFVRRPRAGLDDRGMEHADRRGGAAGPAV